MAAGIFEVPELELSEPEAKALSDAVRDVGQYYMQSFDPKKVAMFNLAACMGGIYATRIMAYRNRIAMERRAKLTLVPKQAPAQPTKADDPGLSLNPPILGGGEW